jgi:predicted  nucleic acid-binding Zn-ribbon protein
MVRRTQLQETIKDLQQTLDEEIAALRQSRAPLAEALRADWRKIYDAALQRVGVSGAAQLVDGRCDGCRITLSPLDVDRAKAQPEGAVLPCPECGRLLVA